jgi:hypothetical protein
MLLCCKVVRALLLQPVSVPVQLAGRLGVRRRAVRIAPDAVVKDITGFQSTSETAVHQAVHQAECSYLLQEQPSFLCRVSAAIAACLPHQPSLFGDLQLFNIITASDLQEVAMKRHLIEILPAFHIDTGECLSDSTCDA